MLLFKPESFLYLYQVWKEQYFLLLRSTVNCFKLLNNQRRSEKKKVSELDSLVLFFSQDGKFCQTVITSFSGGRPSLYVSLSHEI